MLNRLASTLKHVISQAAQSLTAIYRALQNGTEIVEDVLMEPWVFLKKMNEKYIQGGLSKREWVVLFLQPRKEPRLMLPMCPHVWAGLQYHKGCAFYKQGRLDSSAWFAPLSSQIWMRASSMKLWITPTCRESQRDFKRHGWKLSLNVERPLTLWSGRSFLGLVTFTGLQGIFWGVLFGACWILGIFCPIYREWGRNYPEGGFWVLQHGTPKPALDSYWLVGRFHHAQWGSERLSEHVASQ